MTRYSEGLNPQWYDQIQCSINERQLNFQLLVKERNGNIVSLGKGQMKFDETTFSQGSPIKVNIQIREDEEEESKGEIKLSVVYNNGLRYIGSERSKNLDLSTSRLQADMSKSRGKAFQSHNPNFSKTTQQGTNPFNSTTHKYKAQTNNILDSSSANYRKPKQNPPSEQNQQPPKQQKIYTLSNQKPDPKQRSKLIQEETDKSFLKIWANKCNIFSWMDDFSLKQQFEFVPKKMAQN